MGNKFPNLTLKRVLRRNREIEKKYPNDKRVHQMVEQGSFGKIDFIGFISKMAKPR